LAATRVADLDDPRLALYRGVRDPELLRVHSVFLAEGRLVVERLLTRSLFATRSVLATPTAYASLGSVLEHAPCSVFIVEPSMMEALAGYHVHRGCLALGERGKPRDMAAISVLRGPLVCLESVGNPDNVGGVFRAAAAFAASGVVLSPGCSDPLYRKSIRTSMGATLILPFVVEQDWPAALVRLREQGWAVLALTPDASAADIHDIAEELVGARVALLLGHEGSGLTQAAQACASVRTRIPVAADVDSLNVTTAAAIALYEMTSGRTRRPPGAIRR
jgi:tRNA G18 (ribose-2'-O)-methylase SpoU